MSLSATEEKSERDQSGSKRRVVCKEIRLGGCAVERQRRGRRGGWFRAQSASKRVLSLVTKQWTAADV